MLGRWREPAPTLNLGHGGSGDRKFSSQDCRPPGFQSRWTPEIPRDPFGKSRQIGLGLAAPIPLDTATIAASELILFLTQYLDSALFLYSPIRATKCALRSPAVPCFPSWETTFHSPRPGLGRVPYFVCKEEHFLEERAAARCRVGTWAGQKHNNALRLFFGGKVPRLGCNCLLGGLLGCPSGAARSGWLPAALDLGRHRIGAPEARTHNALKKEA